MRATPLLLLALLVGCGDVARSTADSGTDAHDAALRDARAHDSSHPADATHDSRPRDSGHPADDARDGSLRDSAHPSPDAGADDAERPGDASDDSAHCGAPGEPCCEGSCAGLQACEANNVCNPNCGGAGESCCTPGPESTLCHAGFICMSYPDSIIPRCMAGSECGADGGVCTTCGIDGLNCCGDGGGCEFVFEEGCESGFNLCGGGPMK